MINLKSLSHNEFNFLFCFFVVLSSIQETSESTEFGIKKFDKYFKLLRTIFSLIM
jgi:hypothetical protein